METITNLSPVTIIGSLAVGAFICGVALFYLVMNRTRKHRKLTAGASQGES